MSTMVHTGSGRSSIDYRAPFQTIVLTFRHSASSAESTLTQIGLQRSSRFRIDFASVTHLLLLVKLAWDKMSTPPPEAIPILNDLCRNIS